MTETIESTTLLAASVQPPQTDLLRMTPYYLRFVSKSHSVSVLSVRRDCVEAKFCIQKVVKMQPIINLHCRRYLRTPTVTILMPTVYITLTTT